MNLQLWYPAKPYIVTQKWGINNPNYAQFGFTRHNGEDFLIGSDNRVHCPVLSRVEDVGNNAGAGNYVRLVTVNQHMVDGVNCYVGMMFMHLEQALCKKGDILEIGDVMGIPDNTGFSTGPHTHCSYYRLSMPKNLPQYRLDQDLSTNQTFDPTPYWSRYYAQDAYTLLNLLARLAKLLQTAVDSR